MGGVPEKIQEFCDPKKGPLFAGSSDQKGTLFKEK